MYMPWVEKVYLPQVMVAGCKRVKEGIPMFHGLGEK